MSFQLSHEEKQNIRKALKKKSNAPYHRKLQSLLLRADGLSFSKISQIVAYVPQTIKNIIDLYQSQGLEGILKENRGGRNRYYLTLDEEKAFLQEEFEGALDGKHVTIQGLYEAYQEKVGHSTTREGFYALLKRHGWRKVEPRPEHPKKADAKVIEASKNKIYIQEG